MWFSVSCEVHCAALMDPSPSLPCLCQISSLSFVKRQNDGTTVLLALGSEGGTAKWCQVIYRHREGCCPKGFPHVQYWVSPLNCGNKAPLAVFRRERDSYDGEFPYSKVSVCFWGLVIQERDNFKKNLKKKKKLSFKMSGREFDWVANTHLKF